MLCQGKQWGWCVGGEPTSPQVLGWCRRDHGAGSRLGVLSLPPWVMPFLPSLVSDALPSADAGTSLLCSQWTSLLVTGRKHASDASHGYKGARS